MKYPIMICILLASIGGIIAQTPPPIYPRSSDSMSTDIATLKLDILRLKNQLASQPNPAATDRDRIDRLQTELTASKAEVQRLRRDMDDLSTDFKKFKNLFFKHF